MTPGHRFTARRTKKLQDQLRDEITKRTSDINVEINVLKLGTPVDFDIEARKAQLYSELDAIREFKLRQIRYSDEFALDLFDAAEGMPRGALLALLVDMVDEQMMERFGEKVDPNKVVEYISGRLTKTGAYERPVEHENHSDNQ